MVIFNDLRLSDDKKQLVVDCYIEDLNIYDNMYIKEIYIDYYKNVDTSGDPSEKAVKIYPLSEEVNTDTSVRAVNACLKESELPGDFGTLTLAGGLYYVFVTCDGTIAPSAATLPCGYDEDTDIGIIPDWELLYRIGMKHILDMAGSCFNKCDDNLSYTNFILLWNSLKLALQTCEFNVIEKIWDRILRVYTSHGLVAVGGGCGCN